MIIVSRFLLYLYSALTIFRLYRATGRIYKNVRAVGGFVDINIKGKLYLTDNARITFVNDSKHSTLGIARPCKLYVYKNAELLFHGQFGMSNAVIVATKKIDIGCNVMIGGGVTIVDSDFHSLDYNDWFSEKDSANMNSKEVYIGNNVFIGMNSLILKGVHIGDGAIIAASSVVSCDIPNNEVWGGNPARKIKSRN